MESNKTRLKLKFALGVAILVGVFLLLVLNAAGRASAVSLLPTPAATPSGGNEKVSIEAIPLTEPLTVPPDIVSQGPYIRLASGEFDPFAEPVPISLPSDLRLDSYPADEEGYYILQFKGPIVQAWKDAITDAGARIFDYVPDFAFIVKMNAPTKAAVEAMEEVRWVGIYQPGYRIGPQLMSTYALAEGPESVTLIVVVFKGEDLTRISNRLKELGGTILDVTESKWKGKIKVEIDSSKIDAIAHITGVKWVEPEPEWELLNNKAADIMDVRDVWNTHGLYGAGQIVAVCDTGLDQGSTDPASLHDDFEDGSGQSRVTAIYDLVGDGANDVNSGHGTHVAGSVLGNGIRSGSNPSAHNYPSTCYAGMAPEANLVFQAVEDNSTEELSGIPTDLNILFDQARTAGASIHTNSWGAPTKGAYNSESEDVDEYVWDHKDFTILFASGNNGEDSNADGVVDRVALDSPGDAKNNIAVGATENDRMSGGYNPGGPCSSWGDCWPDDFPANPIKDDRLSDDPNGMAGFSSRGPTLDGRFKPDVAAPGTNIASTRSSMISGNGWGPINNYDMYMGGTSMSAPLAAGAGALVRQFYTDVEGINPSAALIKATLINGARDITPGQYGTGVHREIPPASPPNNVEGWSRVDVENSIFPAAPKRIYYSDESSGLSTGGSKTYNYTVNSSAVPLKVTLVWSDYPGSAVAVGGLVNDLDLTVTDPSGTVHYPNHASQRGVTQFLYYDDGSPDKGYAWGAGKGLAVRFTPNSYPAKLDKALFSLVARTGYGYPRSFTANVWDDDGPGGFPGTKLGSVSSTICTAGWHVVDFSDKNITITSGDFYIEIRFSDAYLMLLYDDDPPIDGRSWDFNGTSWSPWTQEDYMIRAVVTAPDYSISADRVNNVVGVDIDTPSTGNYTIRVAGYNVPQGPQPYALVISGDISEAPAPPPGFKIYLPLILKNYAPGGPTPTPTPTQPGVTPTSTPTTAPTATPTATPTGEALKAIVACSRDKSIYIIDATADTAQGPFLRPLGPGDSLLDVVVTPDGGTALVSNFDGNRIYFIDLTAPTPSVLGSVVTTFSAEDIALSPDGRWALVTDGGARPRVASIDVFNRKLVKTLTVTGAQAVAIAADGETVLVADTDSNRVHLLHLNPEDGELTYAGQNRRTGVVPINVAISHDGRTALVANFWDDTVTVLRIDGPGDVVKIGELRGLPGGQQSIAFGPDGSKAYVVSIDPDPDQLSVLNVNGPGDVTDSGIRVKLHTRARCGFYGIDCLAVSPDGRKAYVGNPCDDPNWGNAIDEVTVVDLIDYRVTGQIHVSRYPVGIAFFHTR